MQFERPSSKQLALLAVGATTLIGICVLPYHVAMSPSVSESYFFGYNNRVGQLILIFGAFLIALLGIDVSGTPLAAKPLQSSTLRKALLGTTSIAGILFLLTRKLGGFGESIYLIDRVRLVLEGRTPYKDFEYAYGPAFVYVPAWMSRFLRLPVTDAYLIFWLLLALAGTCLLYITILGLQELPGKQRSIFLFVWAISLTALLNTGVNYSLFRYILPCLLGLLVYRRLEAYSARQLEDRNSSAAATFLSPLTFLVGILLVSPEMAIGFAAGSAAFLAWFGGPRQAKNILWFGSMLAGMAAALWLAARLGLFLTLSAFRAGGMNFPIMPAAHLLLLFFCVGLAACYAGQRLRSGRSSALLMVVAVSAPALAAALGRCDPGHVLLNPLGLWIAAWIVASGMPVLWRYLWPATWIVFFVVPIGPMTLQTGTLLFKAALPIALSAEPASDTTGFDRWVVHRMASALGPQAATQKFANIKALAHLSGAINVPARFHQPAGTVFEAPFGFTPTRFGIYHTPLVDEGYFLEGYNVVAPSEVQRKVAELAAHPRRPLLLLPEWQNFCVVNGAASRSLLRHLFFYPYDRPVVNRDDPAMPICAFVLTHYWEASPPSPDQFGYALWLPR